MVRWSQFFDATSYNQGIKRIGLENMRSTKVGKCGAVVDPVERYSPKRKAEFLLNNAVDDADYHKARKDVRKFGFDPDSISHLRPEQID
jgi:uncharacterized protein with NAD-binding domain and iron-sulfur cluster